MFGGGAGGPEGVEEEGEEELIFNEYAIDDSLDAITRLERYHTSDFSLQRLVLVRELADTAKEAGYADATARLVPLLSGFVSDAEPAVRQMFVDQLYPLASFLVSAGGEAGYNELLNTFLPYCFELLVDKNVEVGAAAIAALTRLVDLVHAGHVETQLLNIVLTLARDDRAEDYRMVAAQLLNDLAGSFGETLVRDRVVDEVVRLSADPSFSVRKHVAGNLAKVAKVAGVAVADSKIVPIHSDLSRDEIWSVRKAAAEHVCALAAVVSPRVRATTLFDAIIAAASDPSRWVRVAAYQRLGQLIATAPVGEAPPRLLKLFVEMAAPADGAGESDMAEYCAFSFPAVAMTAGRAGWPQLEGAFVALTRDMQWRVRRSLACSLHETSKAVPPEAVVRVMLPAYELFLKDLDEVKLGALASLPEFVATLPPERRDAALPVVCALPAETDNWRLRELVASRVGPTAALVSVAAAASHLAPLTVRLLTDSVADVRTAAAASAAGVAARLAGGGALAGNELMVKLKELAAASAFHLRQVFVVFAGAAVAAVPRAVLDSEIAPPLLDMASDRVPNVRLMVARALRRYSKLPPGELTGRVTAALAALAKDDDRDVVYCATTDPAPPPAPSPADAAV